MSAIPKAGGAGDLLNLFQVSISTIDVRRSRDWYVNMFGFVPSGGMRPREFIADQKQRGEVPQSLDLGELQGVPGAEVDQILWLVDKQDFFQFELFEYVRPEVKLRSADWRPCDVGYTAIGLHVDDFDDVVDRLMRSGSWPLTGPMGDRGDRRVCVFDPDGVLVELMESSQPTPSPVASPRPQVPVAARSVTLSVPDLDRSRAFFAGTLGLRDAAPDLLHRPEHEALWGLDGAARDVALLYAADYWVELVQYHKPAGRSWPDGYQITDQGIFNIGLGSRSRSLFERYRDAAAEAGYVLHQANPQEFLDVRYIVDDQGFSVQLNFNGEEMDGRLGFVPAQPAPRGTRAR